MAKRNYRRFTAEEKLAILKEAEQPGVTTAEVCRKHSISPSLLYSWRAVAQDGAGTPSSARTAAATPSPMPRWRGCRPS